MAKGTINASDLSHLRANNHVIKTIFFNTVSLVEVTTLTITATPTTTPLPQLSVSGDMTDVVAGQMVRIFNGSDLIATSVVRKVPSGSTLYIAPLSTGDSGFPRNIEVGISVSDTVTVYTHRPLWAHYSSIRQRTFYKSWDVTYSDQNSQPPPIANTGAWQHADLAGASTSRFTLPLTGSNVSFALDESSLTYAWSLPDGVSLVSGYALSDDVIEVDAIQGQHLVSLTVTDGNAKTHTGYLWLFVTDGDSLGETYSISIESDSQDRHGREVRLKVTGESLQEVLYPQAPILMTEQSEYNGQSVSTGVAVDTFLGYVTTIEFTYENGVSSASVTVVSPLKVANTLPTPPQLLVDVSSPSNWSECTSILSNPLGATYYGLRWALPALFEMHDFDPYDNGGLLNEPRKKSIEYSVDNIYDAGRRGADLVVGNLGSASDGTTTLRKHPSFRGNTYRNSLPTIISLGADDIQSPLTYARQQYQPVSELRGGGFAYDGSNIKAWMGIKRWYQGAGKETMPDFSVTVTEGLDEVLTIVGHALAQKNAEITEISLTLVGNIDVLEPVFTDAWVLLNVDSTYDPYGKGWSLQRLVVLRVERQWEIGDGIKKTVVVTFEPETFGQPAEQFIIGNPNAFLSGNGWINTQVVQYVNQQSELYSTYISGNTDGDAGITWNFNDVSPNYEKLQPPTGIVANIAVDYNSPYFDGNNVESDLYLYVATIEDDEIQIYRANNVLSAPQYELLTSLTANDTTPQPTGVQIRCSETTPTLCVLTYHDQTGVHYVRTTDGGTNWATSTVGSTTTDTSNNDAPVGLAIQGDNIYAVGWDSGSSSYRVYRASGAGAFSLMGNSAEVSVPYPMLYTNDTYLFASALATSSFTQKAFEDYDGGAVNINTTYLQGKAGGGSTDIYGLATTPTSGGFTGNCLQVTTKAGLSYSSGTGVDVFGVNAGLQFGMTPNTNINDVSEVKIRLYHEETLFTATGDYSATPINIQLYARCSLSGSTGGADEFLVQSWTGISNGSTFTLSEINWTEYTFNFATAGQGVFQVLIFFEFRTDATPVINEEMYISPAVGKVAKVDNFEIGETVGGSPTLYRIADPSGTDVWTDITPATDYVPRLPSALNSNIASPANLHAIVNDGSTTRLYTSTDSGDAWANQGATSYRYVKTASSILVAGGDDALGLSVDAGTTVDDKRGNLDAVLNPIGIHYYGIIIL